MAIVISDELWLNNVDLLLLGSTRFVLPVGLTFSWFDARQTTALSFHFTATTSSDENALYVPRGCFLNCFVSGSGHFYSRFSRTVAVARMPCCLHSTRSARYVKKLQSKRCGLPARLRLSKAIARHFPLRHRTIFSASVDQEIKWVPVRTR